MTPQILHSKILAELFGFSAARFWETHTGQFLPKIFGRIRFSRF